MAGSSLRLAVKTKNEKNEPPCGEGTYRRTRKKKKKQEIHYTGGRGGGGGGRLTGFYSCNIKLFEQRTHRASKKSLVGRDSVIGYDGGDRKQKKIDVKDRHFQAFPPPPNHELRQKTRSNNAKYHFRLVHSAQPPPPPRPRARSIQSRATKDAPPSHRGMVQFFTPTVYAQRRHLPPPPLPPPMPTS